MIKLNTGRLPLLLWQIGNGSENKIKQTGHWMVYYPMNEKLCATKSSNRPAHNYPALVRWSKAHYMKNMQRLFDLVHLLYEWLYVVSTGSWFNIKMQFYQYRKSHCGDKTILGSTMGFPILVRQHLCIEAPMLSNWPCVTGNTICR